MSTITNIAYQNNRNSKVKSILIMIAIFLSTMLLTIIATFAYGLVKTNKTNAAIFYGSYYGYFNNVTEEQLQEMQRRGEFSNIGLMAYAGMIEGDVKSNVFFMDVKGLQMTNSDSGMESGRFPQRENEIVAQSTFFHRMGYSDVKIGDKVTLSYRASTKAKFEDKEFVVSGLLKNSNMDVNQNSYSVLCSEDFYHMQYSADESSYKALFQLNSSVKITSYTSDKVIKEIGKKCGISEGNIDINSTYLTWKLDPGFQIYGFCGLLGLGVIVFSVIVIYNIFQVGIVQKIQEYGKIKALGTTKKQMRNLIFKEGMFLAAPSIPLGAGVGYLIAYTSFDWLMAKSYALTGLGEVAKVSIFSLPVIGLSIFFAFLTVVLALRNPMKIVAHISPVEAVKFQENTKSKRALRYGKKNITVFSMAMANISSNRKRTVSTIMTMGLSCVLFVVVSNVAGNIDEKYEARRSVTHGQIQISLDCYIDDEAYPENSLVNVLKDNPLNEELVQQLIDTDGITDVITRNILLAEVNGKKNVMSVLSKEDFETEAKRGSVAGIVNYDKAKVEHGVCRWYKDFLKSDGFSVNQPLTFKLQNGHEEVSFDTKLMGAFGSGETAWTMTEETYKKLGLKNDAIGTIWVDCKAKDIDKVYAKMGQMLSGKDNLEVKLYKDELKLCSYETWIMKAGSYLFLGIIGLIGIMNLINTMIVNIITRKQEYGILQAVGMTNRQLNMSLQIQGVLFTAGTLIVAIGVGTPIGYAIFQYAKRESLFGINIYHFPTVEVGCMAIILIGLQVGLAFLLSRNIKKETLVERIRYQG